MSNNNHSLSKPKSLHHLLETSSVKYGARDFFWDKWQSETFVPYSCRDLKNDTQIIAKYLIISGYSNKNIMIFAENSYYWVAINLAILGYVGVSVAANKDWQAYDVKKAVEAVGVSLIIYSAKNAPTVDELRSIFPNIIFISIDKIADIVQRFQEDNKDEKIKLEEHAKDPNDICQIIFTTGSSGLPKAVPISYTNMASCEPMTLSRLPLHENDVMYLFLPLYHVFGNVSAITSLRIGYSLFICSDTSKISDEIKDCRPTIICGVPLFYERIFNKLDAPTKSKIKKISIITDGLLKIKVDVRKIIFGKFHQAVGGRLKYLVCGAAPLKPEIKQMFLNVGIDFVEAYGMSETCAFITMEKRGHQIANSVGVPYDAVDCKLVDIDKDGAGEVVIKGPNVFKGYYKNGKIDKSSFDKDGYFHTGDLGYFDKQKRLFLTGRKKRLILTSNGENVSPDELEELISKQIKAKKVKVFATDEGIATTIFPKEDDGRADDEFKKIVHKINETLPKFKRLKVININRNSEMSVK